MIGRDPDPDHVAVLEAIERHDVAYVLVGGVGLQLNGWRGATADVDLAIATSDDNVQRLNRALAELGAGPGMPGTLGTTFDTRCGRVELVTNASGIGPYENWARRAELVDVAGLRVRVAHPEDMLTSKLAAGRDKDLDTLPAIRRDLVEAGRLDPSRAGGPIAPDAAPVAGYLVAELGERPVGRRAAGFWDNAAQRIDEHRQRWQITDPDSALGPAPTDPAQGADRAALERTLERTQRLMNRAARLAPSFDLGR